jgi:hypothetical protein
VTLYERTPHPRIEERLAQGPVKVADQLSTSTPAARFNTWLAVKITTGVGTMWCAYAFAALALISLPDAIKAGRPQIISWIAQTFLQLVLLSIIMVGQSVQSSASDARAAKEFTDTEVILDRLDAHTAGGIKDVLDAIHAIGKPAAAPKAGA